MSEVSFKRQIFVLYDGGLISKFWKMALSFFANKLFIAQQPMGPSITFLTPTLNLNCTLIQEIDRIIYVLV